MANLSVGGDPYFTKTSLLLHMEGTNGASTFTDSSYAVKTVTANGGVITTNANEKFGSTSAYFDGNGDWISVSANADFGFGTDTNLTVECWIYPTAYSANGSSIFDTRNTTTDTNGINFAYGSTGLLAWYLGNTTGVAEATVRIPTNEWSHVAGVRSGNNWYVFINGILCGSGVWAGNAGSSQQVLIGRNINTANIGYFTGYMDELRITKGVARYTANFTPEGAIGPFPDNSTDPYYNYVSLMMPMNGVNGGVSFVDKSNSPKAITVVGNTQISNTQSKFGGSSAYFDGSGDYLSISTSSNFGFGTDDFTVECWIYLLANGISGGTTILDFRSAVTATPWTWYIKNSGSGNWLGAYTSFGASQSVEAQATAIALNTWTHIAISRSTGTWRLFVNGVLQTLTGSGYNGNLGTTNQLTIGAAVGGGSAFLNCYLNDLRITKGVARYTANFTPPTIALPTQNLNSSDVYFRNTSLLLPMSGVSNSTTFTDNSYTPKTVTAVGDTKISTAQSKWYGSSAYFDGTGDYLSTPNSSDFDFGSGDLTIEAWVYIAANSTPDLVDGVRGASICSAWGTTPTGWKFGIEGNTTTTGTGLSWDTWNSTFTAGTLWRATVSISQGTWHHVAATVSGGTRRLFLNGVLLSGSTITVGGGFTQANTNGNAISVGKSSSTNYPGPLNGYINDLRITKGVARYTSTFTPPANSFASGFVSGNYYGVGDNYYNDVAALLHLDTPIVTPYADSSTSNNTFTTSGTTNNSTTIYKYGNSSLYLDGVSGTYLSTPYNSGFTFTGDFTIEAWVYPSSVGTGPKVVASNWPGQSATICSFNFYFNTYLGFSYGIGGSNVGVSGTSQALTANAWNHIAVTRSGTTVRFFVNGQLDATTPTVSGSLNVSNAPLYIGVTNPSEGSYFSGYIDELRITKGVARYTASFTPPTQAFADNVAGDPDFNSVSLLMHYEPSASYIPKVFTDSSSSPKQISAGNVSPSPTTWKFGGTSGYFTGSSSFLRIPYNSNFTFGAGDFTVECWINPNRPASNGTPIVSIWDGASTTPQSWILYLSSAGSLGFTIDVAGADTPIFTSDSAMPSNAWTHVAITRSGNNWYMFINGIIAKTATNSSTISAGNAYLLIGAYQNLVGSDTWYRGYIDDLRITKGVARYTSNFTLPTQAYPDSIAGDPNFNSVSLLLHFDASPTSFQLVDSGPGAKTVTANSALVNTLSRFGTSALACPNYNSYAVVPYSTDWNIGSYTNYTIEFWVSYAQINDNVTLMAQMSSTTNPYWRLYQTATAGVITGIYFVTVDASGNSSTFGWNTITESIAIDSWVNVAIVKSGNTWSLYLNGNKQGSDQTHTWSVTPTWDLTIGGAPYSAASASALTLDDVRITKGVARYSSNFVPLIEPFYNYQSTLAQAEFDPLLRSSIANLPAYTRTGEAIAEPLYKSSIANLPTVLNQGAATIDNLLFSPVGKLSVPYGAGTKYVSGIVVNGSSAPLSRTVIAYSRTTNLPLDVTTSNDLTGEFVLQVPNEDVVVVCLPLTTDGVNAEIYDRVQPVSLPGPYDGDPSYDNVKLLLHMNGTNGSTTFTDNSSSPKTVNPVGNAQISTAQSKWGGGSGLFDGSGDYLAVPYNSAFDFGTGNYTIECWVRWNTVTNAGIYHLYPGSPPPNTANGTALGYDGTSLQIYAVGNNHARPYAITAGTWYHLAVVRASGAVRLYVNGIVQGAAIADGGNYGGNNIYIGLYYGTSFTLNGHINDFRATFGVARYTTNFTPPTGPFPNNGL